MPFAKVNGLNLHYKIVGSGPRVLFIHGIGADMKQPVGILNSPVPRQFEVLAYDPRGLGESDDPQVPYSIADMADDAAGLATAVGWDRCHVLGISMGGMVAQELAIRHPALVDRLVIGVTTCKNSADAGFLLEDRSTEEILLLGDMRQDKTWADANPELVARTVAGIDAMKQALEADPKFKRGYTDQARAAADHYTCDRLQRITAPTLVFGGRYDGSCPPESTEELARQIPGARCELLECGHGGWYTDPAAWQMMIDFFNS